MNEEFAWLTAKDIGYVLRRSSEDRLREVVKWLIDSPYEQKAKVQPLLEKELNRRASEAYEKINGGEWI
jgi:hypothetical protein